VFIQISFVPKSISKYGNQNDEKLDHKTSVDRTKESRCGGSFQALMQKVERQHGHAKQYDVTYDQQVNKKTFTGQRAAENNYQGVQH
jgi:hypothetical protein